MTIQTTRRRKAAAVAAVAVLLVLLAVAWSHAQTPAIQPTIYWASPAGVNLILTTSPSGQGQGVAAGAPIYQSQVNLVLQLAAAVKANGTTPVTAATITTILNANVTKATDGTGAQVWP